MLATALAGLLWGVIASAVWYGATRRAERAVQGGRGRSRPGMQEARMLLYSSCTWCGHLVAVSDRRCPQCLHDAHAPRSCCDCRQCGGPPRIAGLVRWRCPNCSVVYHLLPHQKVSLCLHCERLGVGPVRLVPVEAG
jgi:hypothetical protein